MAKTNRDYKGEEEQLDILSLLNTASKYSTLTSKSNAFRFNAKLSALRAEQALEEGRQRVRVSANKFNQIEGTQTAGYAGRGVNIHSGTAMGVKDDTQRIRDEDITAIQNNAWNKAFGYRVEEVNKKSMARGSDLYRDTYTVNKLLDLSDDDDEDSFSYFPSRSR